MNNDLIVKICPHCKSPLTLRAGGEWYTCTNDKSCYYSIKAVNLETKWHEYLIDNDDFWFKPAFAEYPAVLAHEYWRLQELLRTGQVFASLAQFKDVYEVLLKYPILLAIAEIYNRKTLNDEDEKFILTPMIKVLSLGDWVSLGEAISQSKSLKSNKILKKLLQDTIVFFKNNKLVSWRNDTIGHGALRFTFDTNFKQDFEDKLKSLKKFLVDLEQTYTKQIKFLLSYNGNRINLCGREKGRNLPFNNGELFIELYESDMQTIYARYSVSPYIIYKDNGIYFFDSYMQKMTDIINYPDGLKEKLVIKELNETYSRLSTAVKRGIIPLKLGTVNEETYLTENNRFLQQLLQVDDYQEQEYLQMWLEECLKKSKGIFLVEMPRGSGKSTFVRANDELCLTRQKKLLNGTVSVRAYYIDSIFHQKAGDFASSIHDICRASKNSNGAPIIGGSLPQLNIEANGNDVKSLATIINFYRKEYAKHFGKKKFLFIIDGVDQIIAIDKGEKSILNYIPEEKYLEDGSYILITARTIEENTPFINRIIEGINWTDRTKFDKLDDRYSMSLNKYIKKYSDIFMINSPEDVTRLLTKCDYRFLYLRMFKEIYQLGYSDLSSKPIKYNFFEYYLYVLKKYYSEKFYNNVIRILIILASAYEPLTIKELSYLIGEDKISFRLLAYLTDLRGLLIVERSYRGNLISLSSKSDIEKIIITQHSILLQDIVTNWYRILNQVLGNQIDTHNDGLIYLTCYILKYIEQYNYEIENEIYKKTLPLIIKLSEKILKEDISIHNIKRIINGLSYIVSLYELKNIDCDKFDIAISYFNIGTAYIYQKKSKFALREFNHALQLIDISKESNLVGIREFWGTAITYKNRANAWCDINELDMALDDYNYAINILIFLKQKISTYPAEIIVALITTYMNRGILKNKQKNGKKALEDFDKAIEIAQSYSFIKCDAIKSSLASVYFNRGLIYRENFYFQKAIEDLNESNSIFTYLLNTSESDIDGLAHALAIRGATYLDMDKLKLAESDYIEAILMWEDLENQGRLLDDEVLINAYNCLGNVYSAMGNFSETQKCYDKAINLGDTLLHNDNLNDISQLYLTYLNRGVYFTQERNFDKAELDFNKAFKMIDLINSENRYIDQRELLQVYYNRSTLYRIKGDTVKALQDCCQAYSNAKLLKKRRIPFNTDILIELSASFLELNEIGKAIECCQLAINIWKMGQSQDKSVINAFVELGRIYYTINKHDQALKQVNTGFSLIDKQEEKLSTFTLVNAHAVRALVYKANNETNKALEDFDISIDIIERNREPVSLVNADLWAKTYKNRAILKEKLGDIDSAALDFEVAIKIEEENSPLFPTEHLKSLAKSYLELGNWYIFNNRNYDKCIFYLSKSIKIMEKIGPNDLLTITFLFGAYLNLASAKKEVGQKLEAINDFIQVLGLASKMIEIKGSSFEYMVNQSLINSRIAVIFEELEDYDNYEIYMIAAANIADKIYNSHGLRLDILAPPHLSLAEFYERLNRFSDSIYHLTCIINPLKRRRVSIETFEDIQMLIEIYKDRANLYKRLKQYNDSSNDFNSIADLLEKMFDIGVILLKSDFVMLIEFIQEIERVTSEKQYYTNVIMRFESIKANYDMLEMYLEDVEAPKH